MRHKFNASNVNEFITLNSDYFKNLQVTRNFSNRCVDEVFVKMMKKR